MTLDEFVLQATADLVKFRREWQDGIAEDPDIWPESMPEGDWYAQFIEWDDDGKHPQ